MEHNSKQEQALKRCQLIASSQTNPVSSRGFLNRGAAVIACVFALLSTPAFAQDAPVAGNDSDTTAEDTAVTTAVLANDSDPNGGALNVTEQTGVATSNGTVSCSTNDCTYTPDLNFNGEDSYSYEVCDPEPLCASATVTITVNPVNDAPVAGNDSDTTAEDTAVTTAVLANDNDVDVGDTLSVTPQSNVATSDGTVSCSTSNCTYTPDPGFNGGDSYGYQVCDDGSPQLCDTATVTIAISSTNDAPVAGNDSDTTAEDTAVTTAVLANDNDVDVGDTLSVTPQSNVATSDGTVSCSTSNCTYTPDLNFNGGDSYGYQVCDDGSPQLCDTATVTITITPVNDAPVAGNDSDTTAEDTAVTTAVLANDNDVDVGDTLSVTPQSNVATSDGTVSCSTSNCTYTPDPGFNGGDSYGYQVCDDGSPQLCDTATVTIAISSTNDAPVAGNDSDTTAEDTAVTTAVLANDNDVDVGDTLSVTPQSNVATSDGTVSCSTSNCTYTPDLNFNGGDSYGYQVCDDGSPQLCDTATVTITITPVNDAPVAGNDSDTTAEDTAVTTAVLANDNDVDVGDTLSVTPQSNVATSDGTVSCSTSNCTYTPDPGFNGGDSYGYQVCDDGSPQLCDTATVTIAISSTNDAPVAGNDSDTTAEDTAVTTAVLANDNDVDVGDTLSVTPQSNVATSDGTVSCSTSNCTYTPDLNFNGGDSYGYQVCDDGSPQLCDTATVTITITPVNDAPVLAGIGNQAVEQESLLTFTATATDPDVPANALTFSLDGTPPTGASINPSSGVFTWTPTVGQGPGNFSVTVRVTDNGTPNLSDFEIITIAVTEKPNEAPVLGSIGNRAVNETSTLTFDANATDPNSGDVLTFSLQLGSPAASGASINPSTGVFTWTPTEAQGPGGYPITVRVTDDGTPTLSDFETIIVTVREVNQAPVLGAIGNQAIDEETLLTFTASATDPDLPANTRTFSLDAGFPAGASINPTTGVFSWTPTEAQGPGNFPVTIRVTDDGTPALADFENITITVNEVNQAPVANPDTFQVTEGGSTVAGLNVLDDDTDPDETVPVLTAELLSAPTLDPAFVLNADGTFSYTHDGSETQTDSFTYRACDPEPLCSPAATVTIMVDNVNDPPVIEAQLPLSVAEEQPLIITLADLTVTDVDSDPASFVLTVQDGVNYTRAPAPNGNTITPILDFNGDLSVPVIVSDGEDDSEVFNVVVTVTPVNDAPVITGQVPLTTPEDTPLTVLITDLTVVDPDPDDIFPTDFTLQLQAGTNYTLAGNTISPDPNFGGTLNVPATVSDGLLTSAPFALTVTVTAENDEPVVSVPIPPQVAIEGSPFSLNVSGNFSDADNDPLQFTASGLPVSGNLVFDPLTGVFSGIPTIDDARDNDPYIVIVTATDNQPGTTPVQTQFDLNISALDRANVSLEITVAPDPAMLNDELQWTFTASNALGPQPVANVALTGSVVGAGLTISSAGSCTIGAAIGQVRTFDCALGALPVGGTSAVVFSALTSVPGDVVVFASAASTDPVPVDPNIEDNSDEASVGVAAAFSNGAAQVLGTVEVSSLAAGDVNGDGAADLVAGTVSGQPVQIYLSGGFRDFAAAPISLPNTSANEGIALADFDGNGTLDLVVANGDGAADAVYSNDGAGNFALSATLGVSFARGVAVGDFNNDLIADIAIATAQGNPVYLGDGIGGFALDATLGTADSHAVAVADFNGDGRDDVVFANMGTNSQVWLKNAAAGFSPGNIALVGDAVSVVVGEFGGSAAPDLAFGRVYGGIGDVAANPVFVNDGAGGFASPLASLGTSATADVIAGDVNRDGLTDLVFVNLSGVHQIWTSTGSGFVLYAEQIADTGSTVGVLGDLGLADVGDPGGIDLAMGGAPLSGLGVFLNDGFGNLGRGDAVPPVLTLVGEASVSVPANSNYNDVGATAEDNIDGDITGVVVMTSNVNTSVVGNYTVTYNVTDFAGNPATPISRTVSVAPAAGTGGGGGGMLSEVMLFMLLVAAYLRAYGAKRAIIPSDGRKQN